MPTSMSEDAITLHPVILAGGSGTRLWPLSREYHPKQFLSLMGPLTMVQETVSRLDGREGAAAPVIVCNEAHRFILAEQMRQIGIAPVRIVLEPVGRNTAPAAAIAALMLTEDADDALMLISPADHVIADPGGLVAAIQQAAPLAAAGHLVTFGVAPNAPETCYGYIQQGAVIESGPGRVVARFVEKPDEVTAKGYLKEGGYYWNSGMFIFKASTYINELEKFRPKIVSKD